MTGTVQTSATPPPATLEEIAARVAALEQAVFNPTPGELLELQVPEPDPLAEGYRRFRTRQEERQ